MSREINPFGLRMPPELKATLEESARENRRSLNAEIVSRLQNSFVPIETDVVQAPERRKLELVNSFIEWCEATGNDPYQSVHEFHDVYMKSVTGEEISKDIDAVYGFDTFEPRYLIELFRVWIMERPERFPELSDIKWSGWRLSTKEISKLLQKKFPGAQVTITFPPETPENSSG